MPQPLTAAIALTALLAASAVAGSLGISIVPDAAAEDDSTAIETELADPPEDVRRKVKPPKVQHFCCVSTWKDDDGLHGTECEMIDQGSTRTCRSGGGSVLYCHGSWHQDSDGLVDC